jgi:hypothetical protein
MEQVKNRERVGRSYEPLAANKLADVVDADAEPLGVEIEAEAHRHGHAYSPAEASGPSCSSNALVPAERRFSMLRSTA